MIHTHSGIHRPATHPRYYDAVMNGVMGPTLGLYGGVESRGAEIYNEIDGASIAAPDHDSMLDIPVLAQSVLRGSGNHVSFLCKDNLDMSALGWLIEYGDGIFVDRDLKKISPEVIATIQSRAKQNGVFGIFPEATRRPDQLIAPRDIKSGISQIAFGFGMAIVPVGIAGTSPNNRGPLRAVHGEPIVCEQIPDMLGENKRAYVEAAKKLRQTLASDITDLRAEAQAWSDHDAESKKYYLIRGLGRVVGSATEAISNRLHAVQEAV